MLSTNGWLYSTNGWKVYRHSLKRCLHWLKSFVLGGVDGFICKKNAIMAYLIDHFGIFYGWLLGSLFVFLRYLVFAGLTFTVCYVFLKKTLQPRKIQAKQPKNQEVQNEIFHSLTSAGVFALMGVLVYFLSTWGWTKVYTPLSAYGWGYLFLSFWILVFLHDTYFYWMHRLMHHPKLFKLLHRVHHLSYNPTPWAALSFHPLEAIVEIGFLPFAVILIPFHPLVLFLFATWSLAFNVLGHLGYELAPPSFIHHPFWKWFNTPTHHNLHHSKGQGNYGLYFNFWDTWMGTNHRDYEKVFTEVARRNA
jgi:Delta7-sterol 5-desaturase